MTGVPMSALQKRQIRARREILALSTDQEATGLAIREIALNAASARNWLKAIQASGFRVNDDLSRIDSDYGRDVEYRRLINHLEHHVCEINNIVRKTRRGTHSPKMAKHAH